MSGLRISSIIFTLLLILWPILTFLSIPTGISYSDQLSSVHQNPGWYILNFVIAFFIAPALVFMLFELHKKISEKPWSLTARIGFILYGLYMIIISISYGSQFLYLPFIIDSKPENIVLNWYFYNGDSLVILINQTGYLLWSIATLIIFSRYIFKSSLAFFILKILSLSALTQIVATLGLYFNQPNLSVLTFYSGILLLPAGILVIIYSFLTRKTWPNEPPKI
ncbi:MAG: hypothetical protein V2I54_07120 [Bacteroidales bacterium]|jgi:hypothetical protein|nr:hypothetical protein [Bacteroidales bacterium]